MFSVNQDEADKPSERVTRWLRGEATILTRNIHSFVDSSTAVGRNCGRALLNAIACSLRLLLFKVRHAGYPWWELGDYLLADIGKTPGEAEVEKWRRRPVVLDPREDLGRSLV